MYRVFHANCQIVNALRTHLMMFKNHWQWLVLKDIKCDFWWCNIYLVILTTNVESGLHYIEGKVALVDWCSLIFWLFQVECCGMFPPQSCTTLAYFLAVSSGFLACSTPKTKNLEDLDLDCNLAMQLQLSLKLSGLEIWFVTFQCLPSYSGELLRPAETTIVSS